MEEYLDVLDENGNLTGEKKLRKKVHKDGDWHRTVHIWIVSNHGEILLQKRSPKKETHPNMWTTSVSGHLSAGDTSVIGALREIEEEIGAKVNEQELEYLFTVKDHRACYNKAIIDNEIIDVYLVNKDLNKKELKLQKEEVTEVSYLSLEQFEKMVKEDSKDLVQHPEIHHKLLQILHSRY